MLYHLRECISNSLTYVFEPSFGQRVKYTANTGMGLISAANTNLNGTGTIVNIITGASNGTYVETISIKAIQSTTRGMIRLFLNDGVSVTDLIAEIDVPEKTISGVDEAFCTTLQVDFMLKSGYKIQAATQNAESFVVIAEGLDTVFP